MLTAVGLSVVLPVLMAAANDPEPPGCAVTDSHGRCLVIAADPGRPGGPASSNDASPSRPHGESGGRGSGGAEPVEEDPRDVRLVGRPFGPGGWALQPELESTLPPEPGVPGPGPAVDPVVIGELLAQRAVEELTLDAPAPNTSSVGTGYVGVPVWLWIDDTAASIGPVSATATAGAAQVTATARLTAVEWSMGPADGVVSCAGPGTPWTGQDGPSPDCGYTYGQRSLPERTGGSGRWTVTATSVWSVTWAGISGGVPVNGAQTVRIPATTTLAVGEVQVLGSGGGR